MVSPMSGWLVIAFYLAEALAYLVAIRWIARAWVADRWTVMRVAVGVGLLTILLVGLPVLLSAARQLIAVLLILVALAVFLIPVNTALFTYAEEHGAKEQLRRLFERKSRER